MRILYVEDAKFLAEAVKHNLERQGITVDLANDGATVKKEDLEKIFDRFYQVDKVYDLKKMKK